MQQIFGDFIASFPPDRDALELSFTPTSQRIKSLWRNQRLSAHFVADYFSNFLPFDQENPEEEQRLKESKGAISYISNELIENAMKFNLESVKHKVKFGIHFMDGSEPIAVMFATNSIDRMGVETFQAFIQKLLSCDPEEFYVQQIEASVEADDEEGSGLGFLTMINDYQAKLGWKFESAQTTSGIFNVTSMAQIAV